MQLVHFYEVGHPEAVSKFLEAEGRCRSCVFLLFWLVSWWQSESLAWVVSQPASLTVFGSSFHVGIGDVTKLSTLGTCNDHVFSSCSLACFLIGLWSGLCFVLSQTCCGLDSVAKTECAAHALHVAQKMAALLEFLLCQILWFVHEHLPNKVGKASTCECMTSWVFFDFKESWNPKKTRLESKVKMTFEKEQRKRCFGVLPTR